MKIALVHDYLKDFGGAERVLRILADMYPNAPIYTAFYKKGSRGFMAFSDRKVIESKYGWLIKNFNLYSPLRFLLPLIWGSLDLSEYDLVITSCSNYTARGFRVGNKTKVIAYCHTPPRYLYGYQTGDLVKIWPVRIYAAFIAHFLRIFDFNSAQKINYWIVNSRNVAARVFKFYRKEALVIYPPINTKQFSEAAKSNKKKDYFLTVSRLVGTKGLVETAQAAKTLGFKLKIVGGGAGILSVEEKLKKIAGDKIELLGHVSEKKLVKLYAQARGFIALARDEDFGMTVVEAQAAGTPVIAYRGGGFVETVIEGKTGLFLENTDTKSIQKTLRLFAKTKWDSKKIIANAQQFSTERFKKEMIEFINKNA